MNASEILAAVNAREDKDWEFKSARGGLPGSMWETYSAMSNTDGGVIVLGVKENDGDFEVHGLADPAKTEKNFWTTINNRGKVNANLLSNHDVRIVPIDGKPVLVVQVPRASRRQRPIFVGQNPLEGTYRRYSDGDYLCSRDEVGRMLADQSEVSHDARIVEHFTLNDLDPVSLRQYRNVFSARTPNHPWLAESDLGLLAKLGCWREDRATGRKGLTVDGLLMFGKDEAIRDPAAMIHADYGGQGGIVIEKRRDRFSLSNPGIILISFDQVAQGGVSECRNKSLQLMFLLIGGGEREGSGIDKIRQGWAWQNLQSPALQEQTRPDRVRLVLPTVSLLLDESVGRLRRGYA